jgi:transposase
MTRRPAYPCDLSDGRWALIAGRLHAWRQARTDAGVGGRRAQHDLREIFNAILYVNRTGIAWRYLPHDLPPWNTAYHYFTLWTNDDLFAQLNYQLTGLARIKAGRAPDPTAAVIDTQSAKSIPHRAPLRAVLHRSPIRTGSPGGHPPQRPARRHHPRIPTRRVTRMDVIFGRHNANNRIEADHSRLN